VFFRRRSGVYDAPTRDLIILAALGSPDPGRQIDGLGGGISSLSKVGIIGRGESDLMVRFTFDRWTSAPFVDIWAPAAICRRRRTVRHRCRLGPVDRTGDTCAVLDQY
jgi:2-methylaconitate cis-trans-isomerase PrpF